MNLPTSYDGEVNLAKNQNTCRLQHEPETFIENMGGVYQELGGAKHPQGRSKVLILMI